MKTFVAPGLAAVALFCAPPQTDAQAYDVGQLHIGHPWVRSTPNAAPTAAGYLTITNHGKTPERLLGGASPLVQSIEAHAMSMDGGVMRMRWLQRGFEIAPGATLALSPGGDHLMLIGPKRPFRLGDRIPATLRFAHAGEVKVYFAVQNTPSAPGGSAPAMDMR